MQQVIERLPRPPALSHLPHCLKGTPLEQQRVYPRCLCYIRCDMDFPLLGQVLKIGRAHNRFGEVRGRTTKVRLTLQACNLTTEDFRQVRTFIQGHQQLISNSRLELVDLLQLRQPHKGIDYLRYLAFRPGHPLSKATRTNATRPPSHHLSRCIRHIRSPLRRHDDRLTGGPFSYTGAGLPLARLTPQPPQRAPCPPLRIKNRYLGLSNNLLDQPAIHLAPTELRYPLRLYQFGCCLEHRPSHPATDSLHPPGIRRIKILLPATRRL